MGSRGETCSTGPPRTGWLRYLSLEKDRSLKLTADLVRSCTKAFLLAAGLGTRLRPLTDHVPKCLVPIHGLPLLSVWLGVCERMGIKEVLINTHHLAEQVEAWAERRKTHIRITLVHEGELLGSAGTVAASRDFVRQEDDFFIFYADNLVDIDFDSMRRFHGGHGGILTLGLFRSPKPKECGIVTVDEYGTITSFEEKPSKPKSHLANAGILIARQALFDFLPSGGFADFGHDILPKLVGKIYGVELNGHVLDVGTLENYHRALEEWPAVYRDENERPPTTEKVSREGPG